MCLWNIVGLILIAISFPSCVYYGCYNFIIARHSICDLLILFLNSNEPISSQYFSPENKKPALNFSLERSQSQALYTYCTKILEKILQTRVHIHFRSKNIYGDDFLFPKRFMPASGSVKPFASIISIWSHKFGRGDRIRTCDVLLPKQAL